MKSKLPFVIAIPMITILVVIAIAVAVRVGDQAGKATVTSPAELPALGGDAGGGGAGFPSGSGSAAAKSTGAAGTTSTVKSSQTSDLSRDLQSTSDDGGAADLEKLNQEAGAL